MKAVAFIAETPNLPFECGTHNGYVAVPPDNQYHGKSYMDIEDIDIHGGLTFSEPVTTGEETFVSKRTVNPKYIRKRNPILAFAEFITDNQEIGDDWWIFGFDTCHYGDDPCHWNRDRVIEETKHLMEQLCKNDKAVRPPGRTLPHGRKAGSRPALPIPKNQI